MVFDLFHVQKPLKPNMFCRVTLTAVFFVNEKYQTPITCFRGRFLSQLTVPLAAAATRLLNDDDKKYTNKKETTYYSTFIHANQCSVVYFLFFLLVVSSSCFRACFSTTSIL